MSKRNRNVTETIKSNQKTNTGIWVQAGVIEHSDYDTKSWTDLQKDYVKIRDGNALASTTIDILKYPILQSEWRIEGINKEVNAYVQFVFENIYKGFDYFKRHKLLALDFGLSMHEMVVDKAFKYGGKIHNRPVWFNPIQNETINQFKYNEQAMFTAIEHERRIPEGVSEFIIIEADDLEWYSFNEEFNDIRGRSLLRPIRVLWDGQEKIFRARVQSIQRGAGIPAIKTIGEPGSADKANIQMIGRTIGQMNEGYVAYNKEKMEVELLEPKGQNDAQSMLDWIERQMVFNTLSQFMVAGIGQNGSRAATGEHKTSYEMAASVILQSLEENMQKLTNRIIAMSAYGKISAKEYPKFHFNAITQTDLTKTAGDMKSLFDSKIITKQREDEKFLREMFGMPELLITTEMIKPEDSKISMFESKPVTRQLSKIKERKISLEAKEHEDKYFSLESATQHYEEISLDIEKIMNDRIHEYIQDIQIQLNVNRKKDIHIRRSILESLINDILGLYETGFTRGERDINNEVKKLSSRQLQVTKKDKTTKKSIIDKQATKLFFDIKTAIETRMEVISDEFIKNKGGLGEIVTGFELGFKRQKDVVKTVAESGYIDGRGQALKELEGEIETYLYTAIMDNNTCDECAPYDGLPFTLSEIKDEGLNLSHPINPKCLGDSRDRCNWIVLKTR